MLAPEKINVVLLLLKLVVTFTSTAFVVHGEVLSLDVASEETRRAADASWPMQLPHKVVDTAAQYPLYHQYMKGCYDAYTIELCDENEAIRIERNTHQPLWVPRNFTAGGYAKVPAPVSAYKILRDFWDTFAPANLRPEVWDAANIYTNHWSSPTEILLLDPPASPNGMRPPPQMSTQNRQKVIEQVQEILERWTGVALQPTSLYGIRSYTKGSILSPHVDRVPLVISAIINVAQEVEEDWILEVIGHDGYAQNLTMQPGDMILYESHSIIHGRPFPLNGKFYANCFIHFEPIGYSEEYFSEQRRRSFDAMKTPKEKYEAALAKLSAEKSSTEDSRRNQASLPDFIQEGTLEAKRWRQEFDFVRVHIRNAKSEDIFPMIIQRKPKTVGATSAHILAAANDIERIREVAKTNPKSLTVADINGWKPIHEAARSGSTDVMKFLIDEYGVDVNERTNGGNGGSPLWWAEKELPKQHAVIKLLQEHGAVAIAPLKDKDKEKGH